MKTLFAYIREQLLLMYGKQFPNLLEMAVVNGYENYGPFDRKSMKIQIYGGQDEHNPPHVHISDKAHSFDLRMSLETGELLSVKKGRKPESYSKITKEFKEWLDYPCSDPSMENKTNRDMCCIAWNLNNEDKRILYSDKKWVFN